MPAAVPHACKRTPIPLSESEHHDEPRGTIRNIIQSDGLKSMPPVPKGTDALCHPLCAHLASFTRIVLPHRRANLLSCFSHGDSIRLCLTPPKIFPQKSFSKNPPRQFRQFFPGSNSRWLHSFRRVESGPRDLPRQPRLHEFKGTDQGYVSPEQGDSDLHKELQHVSLKGDFIRTYALVEALVKERGVEPNLNLYLALILANTCTQYGSPAEVKRLLVEIENEGLVPDAAIYLAVLKVARWQSMDPVLAIHPHYVLRKDMLEHLRQKWFTVTEDGWHHLIVGMIRDRQLEMVLDTVELLQGEEEEAKLEPWLYDMIVYTLCDVEEFDEALKIMRYRVSSGEPEISGTLWFYLLDTASRALHHDATLYAWRERVETSYLNPPSGVCINVLSTAARHGNVHLATDVFRVLGNRTENLQLYHYESLLEAYMASSDLKTAFTVLCVMISSGVSPSESSTRPIYVHLRQNASLPAAALSIVRNLHESNRPICAPAINVIIEAFVHHHDLESAFETYNIMHELCPSGPTTTTFNALFRGCARAKRKDLAMFLASEMVALKVQPNALTYDRLVIICLDAEAKEMDEADEKKEKTEKTGQEYADAWHYFEDMRRMSWWPRAATVVALAKRCCERGDERVWELVGDGDDEGIGMREMEQFVSEHWRPVPQTG
ncbi:hypothetical protein MMC07_007228 [Pseudocyphellaria aurata]|nr:hypothetical protein [Pseudocyphellaria aurata]